jgi:hypothetical protein
VEHSKTENRSGMDSISKADSLVAIIEDGVISSQEDVAEDPEWPGGNINGHEATQALLLTPRADLYTPNRLTD